MADLTEVIEDAISDATQPVELVPEPEETLDSEPISEPPTEPVETPVEPSSEVLSPAAKTPEPGSTEDFEKKFGLTPSTPGGRENRIPYSRVKKITEKAVIDGVAAAKKEWETTSTPKLTDYETKVKGYQTQVKDYETRLENVAQFEKIMVSDPDKFLTMLSEIPAYKNFFASVNQAFQAAQGQPGVAATRPAQPGDDMPAPDQQLSDGTSVYSMEGLKSLLAWQSSQVEKRVTKQVEDRYRPIESEWKANQQVQAVMPAVRAQIAEARTWPLFNDNETEVVTALQADSRLTLEGAYRKVVFPKITAERNKMREDILKEVKAAPRSTSAPVGATKPTSMPTGPQTLEDIIRESIKTLKT